MILVVDGRGTATCVYDEAIDLTMLGSLAIHRASHVEPDEAGQWWADLQVSGGPELGPFTYRSEALAAERAWLYEKLCTTDKAPHGPG